MVPLHSVSLGRCSCGSVRCAAPGKHPRIRWEPLSERLADRDEVQRWWRRWPAANLGIITGTLSGLVVVDVDPRNGGDTAFAELRSFYGELPHTVVAITGGGGRHFYFRHPREFTRCGPISAGLDLKGDRGIVVCPPSRHASGRSYIWVPGCYPGEVPLAEMPRWLFELVAGSRPAVARNPSSTTRDRPPRTASEREEFAQLWARFEVQVLEGDSYYLCPFHPDHHPSLHIDSEGCRFYCFGCTRGGGLGMLRRLSGLPPRSSPAVTGSLDTSGISEPATPVTLPAEISVQAVGESAFQDELLELSGGRRRYGGSHVQTTAHLVPEPDNAVDPAAIRVVISGLTVGYLSHADAVRFRPQVIEVIEEFGQASCSAMIVGGWERAHGETGLFGVRLMMPRR